MQDPRVISALIEALKHDSYANVRGRAATSLGERGDRRAVEPLIAALEDRNSYVRRLAAGALGTLKDPRALEPLKRLLGTETDPDHSMARRAIEMIERGRR